MTDIYPKPYNFICVILGDNDFGSIMYDSMMSLKDKTDLKGLCPFTVKAFMVESMLHYYKIKHILGGYILSDEQEAFYKRYFNGITVLMNEKFPTCDIEGNEPCDYDGGAIYIDVNTGFISSF